MGAGFQYPAATMLMLDEGAGGDFLLVAYSINKEDMGATLIPLSSLET